LVFALQEEGYTVVAISPVDEYTTKLKSELNIQEHIPVKISGKGVNPLQEVTLFLNLLKIYRRERLGAVLHYTVKPNIYGAIAAGLAGIPCVNNVSGLGTVFLRKNVSSKIAKVLYRFAFRFAKKVFFQNESDRRLFVEQKLCIANKTAVIPGSGINLEEYRQVSLRNNTVFSFLMLSRLMRDKGVCEYLEAASALKETYGEQVEFHLCGAEEKHPVLGVPLEKVHQYQKKGVVHYHGVVSDVIKRIEECHVVVLPSYREGTSKALLEASAIGRPMITTNAPGCRDVVQDKVNGWLVEPKSVMDLEEKMYIAIKKPFHELEEMGKKARVIAEEKFDVKHVINAYISQLKMIAVKNGNNFD
jgi:glycosyltransferase involved in cell wall biosynthesis